MDTATDLRRFPQFAGFDEHVRGVMAEWNVPGTALAVIVRGEVILSQGYGLRDVERRLPVDSQTRFAIGSASKAFTSTALGILADRGLLDWDRPLRRYLPDFRLSDPFASERITPRDLLCHRSGLPGHNMMWFGSQVGRAALVERLAYLQPSSDFRTAFQYQNMMFVVAGRLVEVLSGLSWEEFVRREIFVPLAMQSSNFSIEEALQSENTAQPYRLEGGAPARIPAANIDTVGPAGSINSNLVDIIQWVRLQLEQGGHAGRQIISADSLRQIHTPTMPVPANFFGVLGQYPDLCFESYGLGWFIQHYRGRRLVHHGGHIDGYGALISFMPEIDAGVVFLANDNRTFYVLPLSLNVYDLLLGLEMQPWSSRVLAGLTMLEDQQRQVRVAAHAQRKIGAPFSHGLAECVGLYRNPGYDDLEVRLEGGALCMLYNGQRVPLEHLQHNVFAGTYEEEGAPRWARVQFVGDVDGYISALDVPFEPAVESIRFVKMG